MLEYKDLSFEELRLSDYSFDKTGSLPKQSIFLKNLSSNSKNNGLF